MNVGFPSCRLVLAVMGFFVFLNFFALRVDLSVAIIAMVNSTYLRELEANFSSNSSSGLSDEHERRSDVNSSTDANDDDSVRMYSEPQNRFTY